MKRLLLLSMLLLSNLPVLSHAAERQVLEVITLGYRQANDVIPMLEPLLAPGGTLSGMNNKLIVRTTPANLAELKQILASVDSAPRRLVISVRQASGADMARDAASASGSVAIGDNARVSVPRQPGTRNDPGVSVQSGSTRIEGRAISSRSARNDNVTQTVQVLEGNPAFIRVGQSAPVSSTQVIQTPNGRQVISGTQFVEADTGFYATPRVHGDRVTLEISTSRDRVRNPATGAASVQRVDTVVSGQLGEWMELGGSTETVERSQGDILSRSRDARRDERRVMLKVDEVQ